MSDITLRERIALRVLAVMYLLLAPNRQYDHINKRMMENIFEELTEKKNE